MHMGKSAISSVDQFNLLNFDWSLHCAGKLARITININLSIISFFILNNSPLSFDCRVLTLGLRS